ncbi:MMPL family transporter, partial [Microbacterium sp.]|uniref:MMPL family transporter n=1 Tax=Microbacterium sp. TaxID=51671 RepID=UPI003A85E866
AAVLVLMGILAGTVGGSYDDDFTIPGASSQKALDQLSMTFPQAAMTSATFVVIAPDGMAITDAAIKDELESASSQLEKVSFVDQVQLPYNEYVDGLISDDGSTGLVSVLIQAETVGDITDEMRAQLVDVGAQLQDALPTGSEVHVGGDAFAISIPSVSIVVAFGLVVAIIVLLLTLGSVWAAMMPVISALVGAGISILLIQASSGIFAVSSTVLLLALMLSLAVGIDYSLFIVSRHRDQLAKGADPEESAARAVATAGSAVVFAGTTVVIALIGLGIAGLPFLTVMGVFAAISVATEVALALTLLPAMLGFAGERLRPKRASDRTARFHPARWWVGVVTKVPALTVAGVVVGLGLLAIPATHLHLALPNSGNNPPTAPDRITYDLISERFGPGYNGPLVITGSIVESDDPLGVIDGIKTDVEGIEGVKLVQMAVPNESIDTMLINVIPTTAPDDVATEGLVERLRALAPTWADEYGVKTYVTGFTAVGIDVSTQLGRALLPFGIFVVGLSLVLLTMVFRSVWVPIKAALGYVLSVCAAFGIVTLVFNDGIGRQLVNLHDPQPVISFLPIILMGILFGLAMDYEVFLTTRMREEYVHGNHADPVEEGFLHSSKVVVAAALIMISVFGFFIPEGDVSIKPIALGLAVGVAIDAFVVRMTLGPAAMKLLGNRAWNLPPWLERRLPVLDAEGEAITHELSLADWPTPGATQVIYGENLGLVTDSGATLFSGVDVDVKPGHSLVITGEAPERRGLLLALTGRLSLTSGDLKVLGMVQPQEAGRLRRRSTFVDGGDPDAARALTDPLGDLVVVDNADRLTARARDALRALTRSAADGDPVPTVVLGATSAETVADLLPHRASDEAALTLGGIS